MGIYIYYYIVDDVDSCFFIHYLFRRAPVGEAFPLKTCRRKSHRPRITRAAVPSTISRPLPRVWDHNAVQATRRLGISKVRISCTSKNNINRQYLVDGWGWLNLELFGKKPWVFFSDVVAGDHRRVSASRLVPKTGGTGLFPSPVWCQSH